LKNDGLGRTVPGAERFLFPPAFITEFSLPLRFPLDMDLNLSFFVEIVHLNTRDFSVESSSMVE
jgi:hypothetical protein